MFWFWNWSFKGSVLKFLLKQQVVFSRNTCKMTLDSALCVEAGQRVECCGYYGTICYVGKVPPTRGTWLGVDWDDPIRGMHNGTYKGLKYFDTRYTFYMKRVKINCTDFVICLELHSFWILPIILENNSVMHPQKKWCGTYPGPLGRIIFNHQ